MNFSHARFLPHQDGLWMRWSDLSGSVTHLPLISPLVEIISVSISLYNPFAELALYRQPLEHLSRPIWSLAWLCFLNHGTRHPIHASHWFALEASAPIYFFDVSYHKKYKPRSQASSHHITSHHFTSHHITSHQSHHITSITSIISITQITSI